MVSVSASWRCELVGQPRFDIVRFDPEPDECEKGGGGVRENRGVGASGMLG